MLTSCGWFPDANKWQHFDKETTMTMSIQTKIAIFRLFMIYFTMTILSIDISGLMRHLACAIFVAWNEYVVLLNISCIKHQFASGH